MRDGFIKVAACTPTIRVADVKSNTEAIASMIRDAASRGAKIIAFPRMCLTGSTCGELIYNSSLLAAVEEEMKRLEESTAGIDALCIVGTPLLEGGKVCDGAAAIYNGKTIARLTGRETVFTVPGMNNLHVCVVVGGNKRYVSHAVEHMTLKGIDTVIYLDAEPETVAADDVRRAFLSGLSYNNTCNIIYANAGLGESTTDHVYAGTNYIIECGRIIAANECFTKNPIVITDLDLDKSAYARRKSSFIANASFERIEVPMTVEYTDITRSFEENPFVPAGADELGRRCDKILRMQAEGLRKRLEHINAASAVIGISGGLDSTLALLVTVMSYDLMGKDRKGIIAVTMPCFGTTERTRSNATLLAESLGVTLRTVDIKNAVMQHFEDIGHDSTQLDVTYENSQARERTQILMDIANETGGIVVGTGDLSELALGWATYNGDHMSMYDVNADVPKTMLKHIVRRYADIMSTAAAASPDSSTSSADAALTTSPSSSAASAASALSSSCAMIADPQTVAQILYDVLDTPVSPELLPPKDGEIAQCTENLVGPYELHDFFLYYCIRYGYGPRKIFRLACAALGSKYSEDSILKWEKNFFKRFISQQYKRSCMPDGPAIGSVGLSPREYHMPSDASYAVWMNELEAII